MTLDSIQTTSKAVAEDILIIDDLPDNLRVLSTTLSRRGYGVRCAKSGSMALMGIQSFPPDLILLDIRMPEMDGYEVCRQIKANPLTQDIAVIFLSALDDVPDKVKAFQVGGADYITKPFETEEVLARVQHQLLIRRLQKQLTKQNLQLLQEAGDRQQVEETLRQEISQRILMEAALQDAKEVAEAANYAKNEFLARMSHELRTPLNAVLGFAQILSADRSLTAETQQYVDTIYQNGQHLLNQLNNILTFTSAETQKLTLNEDSFHLGQLLENLEATWSPPIKAKQLKWVLECAPHLPHSIRSDESKLRQVLTSVLENAVKFTDQGQIILRVFVNPADWGLEAAADHSSPTAYPIYFEVEDTGLSMAPHEIETSFEVFSQTQGGHKLEQGLGLGLSISRQFVRLMGGDITVESQRGQGTLIKFYIQASPVLEGALAATPSLPPQTPEPLDGEVLTPETLQGEMSTDWVYRLHHAAIRGFDHSILQLIQEIPVSQGAIAKTLTRWNHNFQFEKILALTQPIIESIESIVRAAPQYPGKEPQYPGKEPQYPDKEIEER